MSTSAFGATEFSAPVCISLAFSGYFEQIFPYSDMWSFWSVDHRNEVSTERLHPLEAIDNCPARSVETWKRFLSHSGRLSKANLIFSRNIELAASRSWAMIPKFL